MLLGKFFNVIIECGRSLRVCACVIGLADALQGKNIFMTCTVLSHGRSTSHTVGSSGGCDANAPRAAQGSGAMLSSFPRYLAPLLPRSAQSCGVSTRRHPHRLPDSITSGSDRSFCSFRACCCASSEPGTRSSISGESMGLSQAYLKCRLRSSRCAAQRYASAPGLHVMQCCARSTRAHRHSTALKQATR